MSCFCRFSEHMEGCGPALEATACFPRSVLAICSMWRPHELPTYLWEISFCVFRAEGFTPIAL